MINKIFLVSVATAASASSSSSSSSTSSGFLRGGQIISSLHYEISHRYFTTAITPDLNCFRAAWESTDAQTACSSSISSDGTSSCVWCSTGGDIDTDGVCLSKDEALMADGQFGLSCPKEDIALGNLMKDMPDINCFKAAWVAENAEDACSTSKSADGDDCVWCSVEGDAEGACLSPNEANMANGQFGLTCPVKFGDDQVRFVDFA